MLVLKNLDSLFERPSMSAAVAGKCLHNDWDKLNSGLLVIKPSLDLYNTLCESIDTTIKSKNELGLACGDQDVFHYVFPRWNKETELHLHESYNVLFNVIGTFLKYYNCNEKDIAIVHFIGEKKPWHYSRLHWIKLILDAIKYRDYRFLGFRVKCWNMYYKMCKNGSNKYENL